MCPTCREILLKHSTQTTWNRDAQLEWTKPYMVTGVDTHCICGHEIVYNYRIVHKLSGDTLVLGSECIKNTFMDNQELIDMVDKIYCEDCDSFVKRVSSRSHLKSQKHIRRANYKPCIQCAQWKVGRFSDESLCTDCVAYNELRQQFRQCKQCREWCIKKDTPGHWYMCAPCYEQRRSATCATCDRKIAARFTHCFQCHR